MATTRKTAAQKAAEAAERDEYTGKTPAADMIAGTIEDANATRQAEDHEELTEAPAEAKPKKETVQQLKNRLRNEAEREVLNRHKDEVVAITQAKYDEHGLEYVRRLSEEEKAAKQIEDLYEKFPQLRPAAEEPAEEVAIDTEPQGYIPAAPFDNFTEEPSFEDHEH